MEGRKDMKIKRVAFVLVLGVLAVAVRSFFAFEKEVFICTALSTSADQGGSRKELTIQIEEFTSDEEILKYMEILKTGGQDTLKVDIDKADKGSIYSRGETRERFNFARSRPTQKGRLITIISSRDFRIREFGASASRSREFRYTFIYLQLDEKGEGNGYMFPGTKIEFDSKGRLILEQIGADAVALQRVRPIK